MDLRNRQSLSDDKETQFIPVQNVKRSSDKYDTQEMSAEEIRRRAMEERRRAQGSQQARNQGYNQPGQQGQPVRNYGYGSRINQPNQVGNQNYNQNYNQHYNQGYGQPQGYNQGYNRNPQQRMPMQQPYRQPQQQRPPQQPRPRQTRKPAPKQKSTPTWQRVLKGVLALIIAVFLLYSAVALVGIFRTNITTTGDRSRTSDAVSVSSVENILVIGTDSRDIELDRGRSDSMILLSINKNSNIVYMTSFLRDVYVYINDYYGYGKLNAAYSYGGAELLMDTIESNYRIKIDDYVIVTFAACAEVIDAVGGVEITMSDEEAKALNDILISEVNELMGDKRNDDLLDGGGTHTLSGKQALSYSRIRYVGNADFERTSRQREVLTLAMKKACKNPVALGAIFMNALPEVTTNISGLNLYGYSLKAPFWLIGYEIEQQQIPADGTFYPDTINGESVLVADFTENHDELRRTAFSN